MRFRNTADILGSMALWEDWPGIDDSHLHRLLAIENGKLTADEAIDQLFKENGYSDS